MNLLFIKIYILISNFKFEIPISESEEEWLREKAGFFATPLSPVLSTGPKRLFATIKTEESGRYNLVECIKLSPDGKFKIFVQLKNGLNWLNFEFCRVVRHLVVNCSAKYAQVEQSHKVKLVYIVSSDSNGEFQVIDLVYLFSHEVVNLV